MFELYDPMNNTNSFLPQLVIDFAVKNTISLHNLLNDSDAEALEIISKYEKHRRECILTIGTPSDAVDLFNRLNFDYMNIYGDWIHHTKIYKFFYDSVDKSLKEVAV